MSSPTPTDDDDGLAWWTWAGAIATIVVLGGAGIGLRHRRRRPGGDDVPAVADEADTEPQGPADPSANGDLSTSPGPLEPTRGRVEILAIAALPLPRTVVSLTPLDPKGYVEVEPGLAVLARSLDGPVRKGQSVEVISPFTSDPRKADHG